MIAFSFLLNTPQQTHSIASSKMFLLFEIDCVRRRVWIKTRKMVGSNELCQHKRSGRFDEVHAGSFSRQFSFNVGFKIYVCIMI